MPWWLQNNIRMIQNNLRDVDAAMDMDQHIRWLKELHANVLQIGCGGITSFYPTQYTDCQWINPYMQGDFVGAMVEKAHANGIRVIVRFDFSKTHTCFYDSHPEWYARSLNGSPIRYNDTVATCINGAYQQERSLQVIEEVLRKYPVDGIFFNMFGYVTRDYSGKDVGICQCENCKRRFREWCGEALPTVENIIDPVFQKYQTFKQETVEDILDRIHALARSINPKVAVSNYSPRGVDIVRSESNSAVDRPLPFWIYNSTDNVGRIEGSYADKISSNVAINAVDLPYRFMGVSDALNRIRLYGNMAMGGALDWCIIGSFEDYTDYENIEGVKEIFCFHEQYEAYYSHLDPKTKILLVCNGGHSGDYAEYRGIFRMLKEEHILFTVVEVEALPAHAGTFDDYAFILFPGIDCVLPTAVTQALQSTTASVIASQYAFCSQPDWVQALFGVQLHDYITDVRGAYLRPHPSEDFPDFHPRKWIYLDKPHYSMTLTGGAEGLLPKVEKACFGPPERCFGHQDAGIFMASRREKKVYLPWAIGTLYYQQGYDVFKRLYLDLMRKTGPIPRAFHTNAPEMVELFFAKTDENTYLLQLINLTGFNGITFFKSLPLDFQVQFTQIHPESVQELTPDGPCATKYQQGMHISLARGELYKAYLIHV